MSNFQVMLIPENKDVILGTIWLREQNPDIEWKRLQLSLRVDSNKEAPIKADAATLTPCSGRGT